MRYYTLTLTPTGGGQQKVWTSYPGGQFDPGALNIIYDVLTAPSATPIGMQSVTVEGISLADLQQSQQFAGMTLRLDVGMGGGMPLENPSQKGPITIASVFQSFGNWIGNDMTLDFVVIPAVYNSEHKGNFLLNWKKGATLKSALQQCLNQAYAPLNMPVKVEIDSSIVASQDLPHAVHTLESLASQIKQYTAKELNGHVHIVVQNGKVLAFDRTYQSPTIKIDYTDLIGQPTWIDPLTMQMKLVARADIAIGDKVFMPSGYLTNAAGAVTTTAASYPTTLRYKSTFTQGFTAIKCRQIGNFRSSNGGEWATILNCVVNQS